MPTLVWGATSYYSSADNLVEVYILSCSPLKTSGKLAMSTASVESSISCLYIGRSKDCNIQKLVISFQESIYRYNKDLLDKAVALLVSSWGTERLPVPADMEAPFMRLIKAPKLAGYEATYVSFTLVQYRYCITG